MLGLARGPPGTLVVHVPQVENRCIR